MRRCSFHPGDTVVFDLTIPFAKEDLEAVKVSFRNNNAVVFEVEITSFQAKGDKSRIGFTMTQEESLLFNENDIYKMQLNVYGANGSRSASKEYDVYTLAQQIPELRRSEVTTSDMDYNALANKPQVNSVELTGNRVLPEDAITSQRIEEIISST